jgi:hypothetical protein
MDFTTEDTEAGEELVFRIRIRTLLAPIRISVNSVSSVVDFPTVDSLPRAAKHE